MWSQPASQDVWQSRCVACFVAAFREKGPPEFFSRHLHVRAWGVLCSEILELSARATMLLPNRKVDVELYFSFCMSSGITLKYVLLAKFPFALFAGGIGTFSLHAHKITTTMVQPYLGTTNKICIKSPCTASTALLALIEVHGLLIQTLHFQNTAGNGYCLQWCEEAV